MRPPALLVALALVSGPLTAGASGDLAASLSEFTKQLQGQLRGDPNEGFRTQVLQQFKQLELALKRGDYERAQQMLQNLGGYGGIPPALQEQWATLADQLAEQIEAARQQASLKWKTEIDQLVKSTREACLAAKTTDDLDPVLVACAALQMRRVNQDNIIAQRSNQRLQAVAHTLEYWSRFLDARAAGNAEDANNALRQLRQSGSGATILTAADLDAQLVSVPRQPENMDELLNPIMARVRGVADLPPAIEQIRRLNPAGVRHPGPALEAQVTRLESLLAAEKAITEGRFEEAERLLNNSQSGGLSSVIYSAVNPLTDELRARVTLEQLVKAVGAPAREGEGASEYLTRVAEELASAKKFAELVTMMETVNGLPRVTRGNSTPPTIPWRSADLTALRALLVGQRFVEAGDDFSAMAQFRTVISAGQGSRYVPLDEAQAELKRLNEAHPEMKKDVNAAMMQQLQTIQDQLRTLQIMMPRVSPNYPPGMPR